MERRGIGHRVPILGGRRLAEVVPLVGGACPSGYCQVDMAVHLVGPSDVWIAAIASSRTTLATLTVVMCRLTSFLYQGVCHWNNSPLEIKQCPSKDTFKYKVSFI